MPVLDLFARAVGRAPEAIAVEERLRRLTYAELDARSDSLAERLRRAGIGAEQLVAICTRPSIETIVAMLAVWKAGGAFVLLDLAAPALRIEAMLADCSATLALVDKPCSNMRVLANIGQMGIDDVPTDRGGAATPAAVDGLAYVVFTSGSTGRPKGVAVTHAGIANLVERQIETFAIESSSRVLQFAPLGFDAVVSEVFTALSAGATLCVEDRAPEQDIAELLAQRAVSVVTLPPSLLRVASPRALAALRTVVSAGEACSADVVARWASGRRMVNAYGPSECTVCATMKTMAGPDDTPTIGAAMQGVDVYVLDETFARVTTDGTGELYLGGVALARGYLGRRSLTAERFVPNPFAADGARLYRTGDIVRVHADGVLEYLGRSDGQVKIRGFRVEPGEIEAALRTADGVDDALVLARVRAGGDATLIAYVVSRGRRPTDRELFEHARQHLPRFMWPSEFVVLDVWPRSPNGKVDRVALAAWRGAQAKSLGPPQTPIESALADLVVGVLDRAAIDLDRGFFDQGGDSIAAVRLVIAIDAAFNCQLGMGALFEQPTLRGLAAHIDRSVATPAGVRRAPYVALRPGGARPPMWLAAPVHGNALCYLRLASLLDPDRPCYGLQTPGLDGEVEPIDDFVAVAARHVQTIRERQPSGPYMLGGWSMGGSLAFEIAVQLQQAGQHVSHLFLLAAMAPSQDHLEFARAAMKQYEPWRMIYFYLRTLAFSQGTTVALSMEELAQLSEHDVFDTFVAQLRALGPFGTSITPQLARRWLAVVRASLYGFQHHTPSGRFDGRALIVRATAQNPIDTDALVRARPVPPGHWEEHLVGEVEAHEVGANHFTLMLDPWVDEVAAIVGRRLGQ